MRLAWAVFGVFCGCASLSGLDQLEVADAGSDQSAADAPADVDTGDASDGATESSAQAPSIHCGNTSCAHGVCCRTTAGGAFAYACVDGPQACSGLAIACDSESDCPSGTICCATEGSAQQCVAPAIACSSADQCLANAGSRELCEKSDPGCRQPDASCGPDPCLTDYASCQ